MSYEVSCGAVVFTRNEGQPRYVIIRSLGGDYGFPKGHMEGSETEEETALREIWEEVGLKPRLLPGFRAVTEYPLPKKPGVIKRVVFFAAQYEGQSLCPQPSELSSAELMTYEQALAVLSFASSKQILTEARDFILSHTDHR